MYEPPALNVTDRDGFGASRERVGAPRIHQWNSPLRGIRDLSHGARTEFARVDEVPYRVAHSTVLRCSLDAPSIFLSATVRSEHETKARADLTAELSTIDVRGADGWLTPRRSVRLLQCPRVSARRRRRRHNRHPSSEA